MFNRNRKPSRDQQAVTPQQEPRQVQQGDESEAAVAVATPPAENGRQAEAGGRGRFVVDVAADWCKP